MSRTSITDAILLRSIPYREADCIVTLLTAEFGRVALLARNARKSRRRFAGSLEPYALIRAEVGMGRAAVGRLAQAQIIQTFPTILKHLECMTAGGRGLELVRHLIPEHEPDSRAFRTTLEFLEALDAHPEVSKLVLSEFMIRLLAIVGLEPQLDCCGQCGKRARLGQAALFDPRTSSVVCRACGGGTLRLSGATRERLRIAATSRWNETFAEGTRVSDEIAAFATELVQYQLGRPWPRSGVGSR